MLSSAADVGDGPECSAFSSLASNAAQLSQASQALQALNAQSLAASAAAAGQAQRGGVAGGACQPAGVLGDDGQSAGLRRGQPEFGGIGGAFVEPESLGGARGATQSGGADGEPELLGGAQPGRRLAVALRLTQRSGGRSCGMGVFNGRRLAYAHAGARSRLLRDARLSPKLPPSSRRLRRRPTPRRWSRNPTPSRRSRRNRLQPSRLLRLRPSPMRPSRRPSTSRRTHRAFTFRRSRPKNLTLLYIDPAQTYLTPYLARAFENSLAFHEKNLHWKPWEPVTILLKDFSDYGNAAALGSPSDMVLLDVAPLSLSMEAFSPGERFFTLMNHEMTHVGTIDVWNSRDASWRHFLGGKPVAAAEASRIRSSTISSRAHGTSRRAGTWKAAPSSWRHGWRAVSAARRAPMTRWCSAPRCATARASTPRSGLESEGTQIDFQVGANSYQYGTRFMSYIALTYGPEKLVEWLRRSEDSKAFYAEPVPACVRQAARRRVERLDRVRAQVPASQSRRARQISADRGEAPQPARARLDVARLRRREDQQPDRRLPLSRARSASSARWISPPARSRLSPTSTA